MTTHYRCARCLHSMDAKFQRSHEGICAWAARNKTRDIGTFQSPGQDMDVMIDEMESIWREMGWVRPA